MENKKFQNSKKWLCIVALFFTFAFLNNAFAFATVNLRKYSAVIIDAHTGKTLYAYNANTGRYPASLTKIMTLYLTFAALDEGSLKLNQYLPVSNHASRQAPSHLGLHPGQQIMVRDAILAVVTKSANDAAVVLAEALGHGSEANFCRKMTEQAHALGMKNTNFANATGLPNPNQRSTAADLGVLGLAILNNFPGYYRYFSTREFSYRGQTMLNHNHLMLAYPGMDGIKTGYINASGFNLVASAVRNHHRLVGVVMGGLSARLRDVQMRNLLNWGFEHLPSHPAA